MSPWCSILVRSMDWQQALKPNLAWLVDAAVCVILDIFVSSFQCFCEKLESVFVFLFKLLVHYQTLST